MILDIPTSVIYIPLRGRRKCFCVLLSIYSVTDCNYVENDLYNFLRCFNPDPSCGFAVFGASGIKKRTVGEEWCSDTKRIKQRLPSMDNTRQLSRWLSEGLLGNVPWSLVDPWVENKCFVTILFCMHYELKYQCFWSWFFLILIFLFPYTFLN